MGAGEGEHLIGSFHKGASTTCTITEIFDQSGEGNNLTIEGAGGNGSADVGADASALPVMAGGHQVYGLDVTAGVGYRDGRHQRQARRAPRAQAALHHSQVPLIKQTYAKPSPEAAGHSPAQK
jgi:hypothetical protein